MDYNALSNKSLEDNGGTHQLCKDMFIYSIVSIPQCGSYKNLVSLFFTFFSQWNGSTIHHFEVDRDFGTDYGICCWFTPQFNFTKILKHSHSESLEEPDWGFWFTQIQKVSIFHYLNLYSIYFYHTLLKFQPSNVAKISSNLNCRF